MYILNTSLVTHCWVAEAGIFVHFVGQSPLWFSGDPAYLYADSFQFFFPYLLWRHNNSGVLKWGTLHVYLAAHPPSAPVGGGPSFVMIFNIGIQTRLFHIAFDFWLGFNSAVLADFICDFTAICTLKPTLAVPRWSGLCPAKFMVIADSASQQWSINWAGIQNVYWWMVCIFSVSHSCGNVVCIFFFFFFVKS